MKRMFLFTWTIILPVLAGILLVQAVAGSPAPDTVPINQTAYWASQPTGPDFSGVQLTPFAARNPETAVYAATRQQNRFHLNPANIPDNIQVSRSGTFTYASNPLNDFSEVMLAIDPTNPDHLLGSSKFFYQPATYSFYTGVFESHDAGLTWTQFQPNGIETYSLTSDPVNTFDELGNGYFTLLTRGPTGLDMLKKPVTGTWELPVVVDRSTVTDKQWIIGDQDPQSISPYAGNVYMSWTSFSAPAGIVFSRSTDRNQTWSPVIQLAPGSVQGSIPGVAPDGTVYVVFGRDIFSTGSGTLEFVKSTDGGATFGTPAVLATISPIPFYLPNSTFRTPASLPAFAVSPTNGNLYVAWSDYRNGDADIYLTRSTDGGTTWSNPIRLNDDPVANGMDQFQPQVSVAPNGRVAVMWFDRRLNCPDLPWIPANHVRLANYCIDTFMTRSFDDGLTWVPNIRASAQTWDWTLNLPITTGGDGFIGDYQGIASSNEHDFPFWNATANLGDNSSNYQQVFVARVPLDWPPPPPPDLTASTKSVTPTIALSGEVLTYTLVLSNSSSMTATTLLTDTLPLSTTYQLGSLQTTTGTAVYNSSDRTITWSGSVFQSQPITITYRLTTSHQIISGTMITNTAVLTYDSGTVTLNAAATVLQPVAPPSFEGYLPVVFR